MTHAAECPAYECAGECDCAGVRLSTPRPVMSWRTARTMYDEETLRGLLGSGYLEPLQGTALFACDALNTN